MRYSVALYALQIYGFMRGKIILLFAGMVMIGLSVQGCASSPPITQGTLNESIAYEKYNRRLHEYYNPPYTNYGQVDPPESSLHRHTSPEGYTYFHSHKNYTQHPPWRGRPRENARSRVPERNHVDRLSPIRTPEELITDSRLKSVTRGSSVRDSSRTYDRLINTTARRYRIDPMLVKAVMHVESAFDPRATSQRGARGLMQLMPETARRYGVRNIYDPAQNVRGAVRYLRYLMRRFNSNTPLVLAAYNAGEDAVVRYRGMPPYSETQSYVQRVLYFFRYYSGQRR